MQISRADVADLIYFMAIARHRSFSRAAIELGVSASALSHALKGLETRLGVRLLNRTTKSVTPTAAGEELVQSVLQPFDTIEGALESLNRYRNTLPVVSASMQPLKRQIFCLRRSCPLLWIAIPILKSILWPATEWLT